MPKPATGKTPIRNTRIPDEVWLPALAKAEAEGQTGTDAVDKGLRWYAREPLPAAYEFDTGRWPEAASWAEEHEAALTRLGADLNETIGGIPSSWLAVAAWLAVSRHPNDPAQQQRILAGHILRNAMHMRDSEFWWWEKFRTARHLLGVVQATLAPHFPLAGGE